MFLQKKYGLILSLQKDTSGENMEIDHFYVFPVRENGTVFLLERSF